MVNNLTNDLLSQLRFMSIFSSSNIYTGKDQNGHVNGDGIKNIYTQGNSVQEVFFFLLY